MVMAKEGSTNQSLETALAGLGKDSLSIAFYVQSNRVRIMRRGDHAVESPICEFIESSGQWELCANDGTRQITLLPLHTVHGLAVTMLGDDLDLRGTVYARDRDGAAPAIDSIVPGRKAAKRDLAMVRDRGGEPTHVVRADGPTGIHVVDCSGNVVALCSSEPDEEAVEVLLLMKCTAADLVAVLSALTVVQLVRMDQLLPVD